MHLRTGLAGLLVLAGISEAAAQEWRWSNPAPPAFPWQFDGGSRPDWVAPRPPRQFAPRPEQWPDRAAPERGGDVRDGGRQPMIEPIAPPIRPFVHASYPANSIVIDTSARRLYYVLPGGMAYDYQISVGRQGFEWTGTETVSRKQAWPDWHPPQEMRERDPSLPVKMTGGLKNPLGAMALYLGTTLYRIHGTNDERSLGQAGSSGCFRMLNANVLHLASITEVGTKVHVVTSLQPAQQRLSEVTRPPARTNSLPPRPPDAQRYPAREWSDWNWQDQSRYPQRRYYDRW